MKRVYLSGPMSGYPFYNESLFDVAEAYARSLGWATVNPARKDRETGIEMSPTGDPLSREEYEAVLASDFIELDSCDVIWMLPHWEQSEGARRELAYARKLGLKEYVFGVDELPKERDVFIRIK